MWGNYIPRDDGVINDAFGNASRALSRTPLANNPTLVYKGAPDEQNPGDAPYFGNVGIFVSSGAVVNPDGPWFPDYQGSFPISSQPHLVVPEPWNDPDIR